MKVISKGCYKGSRAYNNDIIGTLDSMWYVMDGATAVFEDNKFSDESDVYEYMQLLNKSIKDDGEIIRSIKNAIGSVNEQLPSLNEFNEYELPIFTIAGIRQQDKKIDTYLLCDCLISILFKDGSVFNIEDTRINESKKECIEGKNSINSLDIGEKLKSDLLLKNEQTIRMGANKEGGYYVGSTEPKSLNQGYSHSFLTNDIARILICSDGYSDGYGTLPSSKEDFDEKVIEQRVQTILERDKRDDLSYILLEVE